MINVLLICALFQSAISEDFFDKFATHIGESPSTGYDWGNVSPATMGERDTRTVRADVPPGFILRIEQVVGECGGNLPNTDYFKSTTTSKDGAETVAYFTADELPGYLKVVGKGN